jgi:hypothetical protein
LNCPATANIVVSEITGNKGPHAVANQFGSVDQQEDHQRQEQGHAVTVQIDAQAVDGLLVALGLHFHDIRTGDESYTRNGLHRVTKQPGGKRVIAHERRQAEMAYHDGRPLTEQQVGNIGDEGMNAVAPHLDDQRKLHVERRKAHGWEYRAEG